MKTVREGIAARYEREAIILKAVAARLREAPEDEDVRHLVVAVNTYRDCDQHGDRDERDRYMAELEADLGISWP